MDRLSPQAHISVIPFTGNEEFGNFLSHDGESFTFYDVDQKTPVTFRYGAVRTIRNGYGGYGFQHRHVDRHNQTIIVAVVLGGLVALIGAAAAAK